MEIYKQALTQDNGDSSDIRWLMKTLCKMIKSRETDSATLAPFGLDTF